MNKLNRIANLLSLILISGLLGGCVKPCEVDWYQGCPETAEWVIEQQQKADEVKSRKQQQISTRDQLKDNEEDLTYVRNK